MHGSSLLSDPKHDRNRILIVGAGKLLTPCHRGSTETDRFKDAQVSA